MGLIQEAWREEKCRIENGIFFADDTAIEISRNSEGVYASHGNRISLNDLISKNGGDWYGHIYTLDAAKSDELVAKVGETAWEGGGFVALLETRGKLIWIIHLENSEGFTDVTFSNGKIMALATYYPHENTLEIPATSPQDFKFTERSIR